MKPKDLIYTSLLIIYLLSALPHPSADLFIFSRENIGKHHSQATHKNSDRHSASN
jgi:hypothetical protein